MKDIFISLTVLTLFVALIGLATLARTDDNNQKDGNDKGAQFVIISNGDKILSQALSAGANPVRYGLFNNILIISSDDQAIKDKLYDQGVYLVLNAIIEGGCFSLSKSKFVNT